MNFLFHRTKHRHYFNSTDKNEADNFSCLLRTFLREHSYMYRPLVFLCIGTDRATGDCLGPLIGQRLNGNKSFYHVYGTLQKPVHAKNLVFTIDEINSLFYNPLIIAIDASLGNYSHVGYVTLTKGPLKPGAGVDKDLPLVGDLSITGIVNISGFLDQMLLQTTRLNTVMQLADYIHDGISSALLGDL